MNDELEENDDTDVFTGVVLAAILLPMIVILWALAVAAARWAL